MFLRISKYSWAKHYYEADARAHRFINKPWSGGVILLCCVVVAMLLANMEWSAEAYHALLTTDLSAHIHSHDGTIDLIFPRDMNVERLVNDALMVLFFFVVGLEIKREVLYGELSSIRNSILPILAAVGGMIVPAIIYAIFNQGTPVENGWGIPMATDIAFAVGILSMLGKRVPLSLKVFLTALAIVDDLGAIIVIALFYGGQINMTYIFIALVVMGFIYLLNRAGETRSIYYIIPAVIVWTLFYYSGVHATMSGVVMAMLIPIKPRYNRSATLRQVDILERNIITAAAESGAHADEHYHEQLRKMSRITHKSIPMSAQLEDVLAPYITFVVMPIFALVNGGVRIDFANIADIFSYAPEVGSIGLGIIFGLFVGKPVGIFLMSWLAIKLRLASMPNNATWMMLFAVSCLGGIGFTMSIFVDTLAFSGDDIVFVDQGKIAIIIGSILAAVVGAALIFTTSMFSKSDNK